MWRTVPARPNRPPHHNAVLHKKGGCTPQVVDVAGNDGPGRYCSVLLTSWVAMLLKERGFKERGFDMRDNDVGELWQSA
jgi:hypothetical protein